MDVVNSKIKQNKKKYCIYQEKHQNSNHLCDKAIDDEKEDKMKMKTCKITTENIARNPSRSYLVEKKKEFFCVCSCVCVCMCECLTFIYLLFFCLMASLDFLLCWYCWFSLIFFFVCLLDSLVVCCCALFINKLFLFYSAQLPTSEIVKFHFVCNNT